MYNLFNHKINIYIMENPNHFRTEDFKDFETVAEGKLPKSPINLERHKKQAENDPMLKERLQKMVDICFAYTKDFASHERLRRMGKDTLQETAAADAIRTATHEGTMLAVISYREALEAKGLADPDEPEQIPTRGQSRNFFGKFALLLTLNRFKDQIQLISQIREKSQDVDYEKLKTMTENEAELLVIGYVEILSTLLDNDDMDPAEVEAKEAKLQEIESELQKDESSILNDFVKIHDRSNGPH
jgi:hypothetical protein